MKLQLRFDIHSFQYAHPAPVGKTHLNGNDRLHISISSLGMSDAFVDLCSLPNFHNYTLHEWKFILEDFFTKEQFHFDCVDFSRPYFDTTHASVLKDGELLFIIESVLFAFIEKNYSSVLDLVRGKQIKLNSLFIKGQIPSSDTKRIKIKIRPTDQDLVETLSVLKYLSSHSPSAKVRLDGNRTFDLTTLLNFIQKIESENFASLIEYIEEPFKNFNDFFIFHKISKIPLALDESVFKLCTRLEDFPHDFFILKPSLLGISKCVQLSNQFHPRVIISSSFEFPSAMRSLYFLSALNSEQWHGLDTLKYLPKEFSINGSANSYDFSF